MSAPDTHYKQTTIEAGTQFAGTLSATCQVVVRGHVDGELIAPSLLVTETGVVTGHVKVQTLQCAGTLGGSIEADDIQLSGHVRRDTVIRAKTLTIDAKAQANGQGHGHGQAPEVTFGDCLLEVGDDPDLQAQLPATPNPADALTKGKKSARRIEPAAPRAPTRDGDHSVS